MMKILVVSDFSRWEELVVYQLKGRAEIFVARSVDELKTIALSGQEFLAVALDGWLRGESTLPFIRDLLKLSKSLISVSNDIRLRKEMITAGCHCRGDRRNFIAIVENLRRG